METGSSHIQTSSFHKDRSLDQQAIEACKVIFSLSDDKLQLVVADRDKRVLASGEVRWKKETGDEDKLSALDHYLKSIELNILTSSMEWYFNSRRFVLVPAHMSSQKRSELLLSYNSEIEKGAVIVNDYWQKSEVVSVFAIPEVLESGLSRRFGEPEIHHGGKLFSNLEALFAGKSTFGLLHLEDSTFSIYLSKESSLQFFNVFSFQSEEDVIYFLLFALEQTRILPTELKLLVSGKVRKEDRIYKLLETYIDQPALAEAPPGIKVSSDIPNINIRQTFHLLGSL